MVLFISIVFLFPLTTESTPDGANNSIDLDGVKFRESDNINVNCFSRWLSPIACVQNKTTSDINNVKRSI